MQGKDAVASRDLKTEIKEYITHHLEDAYDFSLFSYTNKSGKHIYIGIPLPVILWDEELHVFSSSKLHHGLEVAASGNKYYKLDHGKIYRTDASGIISFDQSNHSNNIAPLDLSITKGVASMILIAILMFVLFRSLARSYEKNGGVPNG
ncbi:MAG: F0F1 ATP synthase subunit A, partial [Flavobacteriales bacterium]